MYQERQLGFGEHTGHVGWLKALGKVPGEPRSFPEGMKSLEKMCSCCNGRLVTDRTNQRTDENRGTDTNTLPDRELNPGFLGEDQVF